MIVLHLCTFANKHKIYNFMFISYKIKIFYIFILSNADLATKKNIQKCKNLVITHREMCMKS